MVQGFPTQRRGWESRVVEMKKRKSGISPHIRQREIQSKRKGVGQGGDKKKKRKSIEKKTRNKGTTGKEDGRQGHARLKLGWAKLENGQKRGDQAVKKKNKKGM